MSKEKPILFNDEMVRAILEGRKTQTRRALDVPAGWSLESAHGEPCVLGKITSPHPKRDRFGAFIRKEIHPGSGKFQHDIVACRHGGPGDRLWVREAWRQFSATDECGCSEAPCGCLSTGTVLYRATDDDGESKWRPSIHMPRWASRITLGITSVRVERLQDISADDARAEGCSKPELPPEVRGVAGDFVADERTTFAILWNRINGPGSWAANPFVWVIEFRHVEAQEQSV
ncbi:hypothetical protein NLU14_08845 [Marinobacter sp. 71-i]|uniref:Morphogenetic protein n=1 Tax=Marinobacter iranensis TaxID=2962607 RepID=A0ABT5Y9I2_9GAMM|nr:hypothetical protein [Marinobacter iranensis]MDF0750337.1 hypothetical protein [Marinobacter iranensis]